MRRAKSATTAAVNSRLKLTISSIGSHQSWLRSVVSPTVRRWFRRPLPSPSVAAVELALGVQPSDAGIDLRPLILVDPPGRDPFGEPVSIAAAAPALLQEMGVVIPAEQGQIVKISKAAENPIQNVMAVAPRRRMCAAGE